MTPARHSQATQRGVTEAEETAQSRQADVKQMQADVKRHRWVLCNMQLAFLASILHHCKRLSVAAGSIYL